MFNRKVNVFSMTIWLAMNVRGGRSEFHGKKAVRDLQRLGVNVFCLQETHLIASDYNILCKGIHLY